MRLFTEQRPNSAPCSTLRRAVTEAVLLTFFAALAGGLVLLALLHTLPLPGAPVVEVLCTQPLLPPPLDDF